MVTETTLARKTKAEIIDEYLKLRNKLEGARELSQSVNDPKQLDLLAAAQKFSPDAILREIGQLKLQIHSELDGLAEKLIASSKTLNQLQEAVGFSKNQLQNLHNIQIGVESVDQLVKEYEEAKMKQQLEYEQRKLELDSVIASAKRQWEREKEEQEYQASVQKRRAKEQLAEELAKERTALEEREKTIMAQEAEVKGLQEEFATFPERLEKAAEEARKKAVREIEQRFAEQLKFVKREHENELNIAKLNLAHSESAAKSQSAEIAKLRSELERAYLQSQNMAARIIESSGMIKPNKQLTENHKIGDHKPEQPPLPQSLPRPVDSKPDPGS